MTSVSRRSKHLKASYEVINRQADEHARSLESAITERVLEQLSDDEQSLTRGAIAKQEGSFHENQTPAGQWAALNEAYTAALDEENRKSGSHQMQTSTASRPAKICMLGATEVRSFSPNNLTAFPLPLCGDDRHRGGGHPPTPATPPYVRVRTRRFESVTLTFLE